MKRLFLIFIIFFAFEANSAISVDTNFQVSKFTEGKDNYYLSITLAGYEKSDISASVSNGILLIEAKKGKKYNKNTFSLPIDAEAKGIEAKYNDNILTFKIKKVKEKSEEVIKIQID